MVETVNWLLDKLISVGWRLLDLPVYAQVIFMMLLLVPALFIISKAWKNRELPSTVKLLVALGLLAIPILLVLDHRHEIADQEIEALNAKYLAAVNNSGSTAQSTVTPEFQEMCELKDLFDQTRVTERSLNEAMSLVTISKENPKAKAFLTIIDLTHDSVELVITPEYTDWKTLTSEFGRKHNCDVAINGEAGEGMSQGSGYGEYLGTWVANGVPVRLADTDKRPFLSFDRANMASYSPEKEVVSVMSENMFNAFWGRWDLILNGEFAGAENNHPYARTIMAIDRAGERLYLMVVDGKREQYSLGLSFKECSDLLVSLGAYNGMACDQGGSVAMYLSELDGILNRPADSDGLERPVYTHFGVRFK